MKTKNKNLLYLALIFALILAFCGALVLSVYTAEKVAFADDEYIFTQYIYSDPLPMVDNDCWSFMDSYTMQPNYLRINRGFTYTDLSITLSANHLYALYYRFFCFGASDFIFTLPDSSTVSRYYSYALSMAVSFYDDVIFFTPVSDTTLYISCETADQSLSPFGISSFYFSDVSLTPFYSSMSSLNNAKKTNKVLAEFGNFTKVRTLGVPYDTISSYSFVSLDYQTGYDDGYNDGFSSGVNFSRGISYTFTESDYVPEFPGYPLFENVIDNYWSIWAITDDEAWLKSSLGFTDMFGYSYAEMKTKQVSFQWFLPTASVSEGYYSYGSRLYSSIYVTFDDSTECIVLSDSEFPITETYNIYIEMFSTHTMISTSWFGSHVQTSQAVPNFYNGFGIDIYALTFSLNDPVASVYADGFNTGVSYADGRVNGASASYNAGYNNGVTSAGNYTFKSLIASVIDVPLKTFTSLFNFDFLGINMLNFLFSLLTIGIIIGFIKLLI